MICHEKSPNLRREMSVFLCAGKARSSYPKCFLKYTGSSSFWRSNFTQRSNSA